jgi:hypothetical protein
MKFDRGDYVQFSNAYNFRSRKISTFAWAIAGSTFNFPVTGAKYS